MKTHFFVQARPGEAYHVESDAHCEFMLCGKFISVDSEQSKVQYRWGPRKCPDCWIRLEAAKASDDAE